MGDNWKIEVVGLNEAIKDMRKAATPNTMSPGIKRMDAFFDAATTRVDLHVHEQTGRLRLSGRSDKHYMFDTWQSEITYRANPGIFELARGDTPSAEHPEGGHFFFQYVEFFIPHIEEALNSVFDDYFGKAF